MFGNPIQIDNQSFVGVFLIGVLEKQNFHISFTEEKKETSFQQYTEKILCIAPYYIMRDFGWNLKRDHIIQFNRFFDNMFDHDLYLFVKRNINSQSRYAGYKQSIESFAEKNCIELETTITFEALKKREYRYRTKIETIFSDTLSLPNKQATLQLYMQ